MKQTLIVNICRPVTAIIIKLTATDTTSAIESFGIIYYMMQ